MVDVSRVLCAKILVDILSKKLYCKNYWILRYVGLYRVCMSRWLCRLIQKIKLIDIKKIIIIKYIYISLLSPELIRN